MKAQGADGSNRGEVGRELAEATQLEEIMLVLNPLLHEEKRERRLEKRRLGAERGQGTRVVPAYGTA